MGIDVVAAVTNSDGSLTSGYARSLVIVGLVVALLVVGLIVGAVLGILTHDGLAGVSKVVWILAVLAFPLLGAMLWFLFGRQVARSSLRYR